ncbi:hypothetical protein [Microbacterium sp. CH12i]|uniref:hypothetical protein n=1 Tax=Microbacterium sp. CH12i TaxID=1479651 RepID=UPI00190F7644|nr:hypothetical protein [Microbacterium sp. CH12i]
MRNTLRRQPRLTSPRETSIAIDTQPRATTLTLPISFIKAMNCALSAPELSKKHDTVVATS